jgi:hypothetical protein
MPAKIGRVRRSADSSCRPAVSPVDRVRVQVAGLANPGLRPLLVCSQEQVARNQRPPIQIAARRLTERHEHLSRWAPSSASASGATHDTTLHSTSARLSPGARSVAGTKVCRFKLPAHRPPDRSSWPRTLNNGWSRRCVSVVSAPTRLPSQPRALKVCRFKLLGWLSPVFGWQSCRRQPQNLGLREASSR